MNFDMIINGLGGVSEETQKKYKTIENSRLQHYPKKEKDKALSATFRCPRKDLYVSKQLSLDHFLKYDRKNNC